MLSGKPEDLNSSPGTHTEEAESIPIETASDIHLEPHAHIINKISLDLFPYD